jgi:hypothetical protein
MEMRTSKSTKNVLTAAKPSVAIAAKRDHRIREFITAQLAYVLADEGTGEEHAALVLRDTALATLTHNERLHAAAIAVGLKNVLQGLRNGMPGGELAGVAVASAAAMAIGARARDAA